MTAQATRLALTDAFGADAGVRAALGHPVRLSEAPPKGALPAAVWRRWETRPLGASLSHTEEHTVTLEILTREAGVEQARAAVAALVAAANGLQPVSEQVRIILVLPVYSDVLRPSDQRGWYGIVRLKVIAEAA
jgi:hypothetical protein